MTYEWFQGVPPTSPSTDDLFFTVGGSTRAVSARSSTETFTPGDSITFADTSAITIVANYSGVDNFGFADCSTPAGCITFLSAVGLDSNSVDEQAATVTVQKCEYLAGTPSCPLIQLIRLLEDPTLTPEPTPFPTAVPTSLPTVTSKEAN